MASSNSIACPHCGVPLKGGANLPVGKTIKCKNCDMAFRVEEEAAPPPMPAPCRSAASAAKAKPIVAARARRVSDDDDVDDDDQPEGGSRKGMVIALVALLLLLLAGGGGLVAYLMLNKDDTQQVKKDDDDKKPEETKPATKPNSKPEPTKPAEPPPPGPTKPVGTKPKETDPSEPVDIDPPSKGGASATVAYERLMQSVVFIVTPMPSGSVSFGSGGVFNAKERLVLTNYHVVQTAKEVLVYFPAYDAKKELITDPAHYQKTPALIMKGTVLHSDMKCDLAVVQLDKLSADVKAIKLAEKSPKIGDALFSVGASGIKADRTGVAGTLWRLTTGKVRQVYKNKVDYSHQIPGMVVDTTMVESDAPTNPGDSGGPVFNDRLQLVAVVQGVSSKDRSVSYNVDIREVKAFLDVAKTKHSQVAYEIGAEVVPGGGGIQGITECIKALSHADAAMRTKAALVLAEMGPEAKLAIPSLVKVLQSDTDTTAKIAARDALTKIGPPAKTEIPFLKECAKDSKGDVRLYAVKSLASFGPDARPALKELLSGLDDGETDIRVAAARALGKLGPEVKAEVAPALQKLLADSDRELRVAAVEGLTGLLKPAAEDMPVLLSFLKLKDAEAQKVAVSCLGKLGPDAKEAVKPLLDLNKTADKGLRKAIFETLGQIGPMAKEAIPTMADGLKDSEKEIKTAALKGLTGIGPESKSASAAIAALLKDGDAEVRKEALAAVGKIGLGSKEVIDALGDMLKDNDVAIRDQALATAAAMGAEAKALIPKMLQMLDKEDKPEPRKKVTDVIAKMGKAAVPALKTALDNRNDYIRWGAIVAAGEIGPDAKELSPLLYALSQRDPVPQFRGLADEANKKVSAKK